jgi:PilZ domain-containing protein
MDKKMLLEHEQRKEKRFQLKKCAFAIPSARSRKLWQIMDISKGGLAFQYVANGERLYDSSDLDIAYSSDSFYLEKVPFKAVSDLEVENGIRWSSLKVRRCGVQFGELTQHQVSLLEDFIQNQAR